MAALAATLVLPGCLPRPVAASRSAAVPASRAATATAAADAAPRPAPETTPPSLVFVEPVDAEVVDGWRPPSTPYGPGNRGWEYDTAPGDVVSAAGDGTVTFAGPVGGSHAVTVAHVGGLTTTYSYLDAVDVTDGDRVRRGDRIATAGESTHFGVRLDGAYVDPAVLFRPGALRLGARLLARSGRRRRSATLTRRPALGWAERRGHPGLRRTDQQLAPGPPTVASRAGPGTSNRWEGERLWPLSA
jgi:murein DD-endopeptidase MepM/ murein hydrolase activator NlpD